MATSKSGRSPRRPRRAVARGPAPDSAPAEVERPGPVRATAGLFLTALIGLGVASLAEDPADLAARARRAYEQAAAGLATAPSNSEAAWHYTRACFDLAEFATNSQQRAELAERGIAVGRQWMDRDPTSAAAPYYLAMNLGQLARTKLLGALKLVSEMERLFLRAAELDANFDFGGPDRCLGLLYRDAPGWPASVGSRRKARWHLERSVALSPAHPENPLNLLESQIKWGEDETARADLPRIARVLQAARSRLTGEEWRASWADWDRRWREVLTALHEPDPLGRDTKTG